MTTNQRIAIIGGGPGGLMLARLLELRGIVATVFERDAHQDERPQGGSLDLHAESGQYAMRRAGLEKEFNAEARPDHQGDRLYDAHGTLLFDHDGIGDDRPEIDRSALRHILLRALSSTPVRWGSKITCIREAHDRGYEVVGDGIAEHYDVVIGADGAWSRVRPLVSPAAPIYEGAAFVELGFDTHRHPDVDALVGSGKMFAVGDNRVLIGQRNGHGHIRGYAGLRMPEVAAQSLSEKPLEHVRAMMMDAFAGWSPALTQMIRDGDMLGVRPMYALPIGHSWVSKPGITLLGDAAHVMSPFSGEGVNLALADAVGLADALNSGDGWTAIARYEADMVERATPAAEAASGGLHSVFSAAGAEPVLAHYRSRVADRVAGHS